MPNETSGIVDPDTGGRVGHALLSSPITWAISQEMLSFARLTCRPSRICGAEVQFGVIARTNPDTHTSPARTATGISREFY